MEIRSCRVTDAAQLIWPLQMGAEYERIDVKHHSVDRIVAAGREAHSFSECQISASGNVEIGRCDKLAIAAHFTAVKRKIGVLGSSEIPQNTIASERQNRTIRKYAAVFYKTLFDAVFEKHLTACYFHIHKGGIFKNCTESAWRYWSKIAAAHPEAPFGNPEIRFENAVANIDISTILIFSLIVPIILHVNTSATIGQSQNLASIQNQPRSIFYHIPLPGSVNTPLPDHHLGEMKNILHSTYDRKFDAENFQTSVSMNIEIR